MPINITPQVVGYPLQTATTITLMFNSFEASSATTSATLLTTVYGLSGTTVIGSSYISIPPVIFTAFTKNVGSSGITTLENYVLANNGFTRA